MRSLQGTQNVHSYEQMRAGEPGGSAAFPHRSQLSRISKAMAPQRFRTPATRSPVLAPAPVPDDVGTG
ncbi:hypothetical protein ACFXPV_07185 [Streptomyces sp. NPDC059118]|uniref:hypothetical protein n=1 Tax=unclassified Streptomyces TaxID=2593676 RepID=UPI0036BA5B52